MLETSKINRDHLLVNMKHADMPFALNAIYSKNEGGGGYSNEEGFSTCGIVNKPVIGILVTEDTTVVWSGEGATSEIGVVENCVYTVVLRSALLNHSKNAPIEAEYYYNNLGHLVVAWWDGLASTSNAPRIMNFHCLPFAVNGSFNPVNALDIALLDLFPQISMVEIKLNRYLYTAGSLPSGALFFSVAYQFADGSTSQFMMPSLPVYINKDSSAIFNLYNGVDAGTPTTKAVEMLVTGLPVSIKKITYAAIFRIGGVETVRVISDIMAVNGVAKFLFTGTEGILSSLSDVLIPTTSLSRVWSGTTIESKLYFANVIINSPPNIQGYVNAIETRWEYGNQPINLSEKNSSNKDMVFIFDKRQFKAGEVYAIYLIGYLLTGEPVAYHIPGRPPQSVVFYDEEATTYTQNDLDLISTVLAAHPTAKTLIQANKIAPGGKIYEVLNTATSGGKLGYWQNQDEFYPDTSCWDILAENGSVLGTLRNKEVRHHKFPSVHQLKSWNPGLDWVTGNDSTDLDILELRADSTDTPDYFQIDVDNGSGTYGSSVTGAGGFEFTFTIDANIRIDVDLALTGVAAALFQIEIHRGSITFVLHKRTYTGTGKSESKKFTTGFKFKKNDILKIIYTAASGTHLIGVNIRDWDFARLEATSYMLGFRLQNINIPPEYRKLFSHFEIGFAERTEENKTIQSGAMVSRGGNGESMNIMSLDMMSFHNSPTFDYVDTNVGWKTEDGIFDGNDEKLVYQLRQVTNAQFIPGYDSSVIDNHDRGEELYAETATALDIPAGEFANNFWFYADLKVYKRNVFYDFAKQTVIPIGNPFTNNEIASEITYGGDTFMGLFGWYDIDRFKYKDDEFYFYQVPDPDANGYQYLVKTFLFPTESIVHSGLRTWHDDGRFSMPFPGMEAWHTIGPDATPTTISSVFKQSDNAWLYNNDYNSIRDLVPIPVFVCKDDCYVDLESIFPNRIYRSVEQGKETGEFRWRLFQAGDYYDMVKNKGAIWVITGAGDTLLINTRSNFFTAAPKDRLATSSLDVYLKPGDVFSSPPKEELTSDHGFGGCQNKYGVVMTKGGFFFPDRQQGKWFQFTGKLEEVGHDAIRNWLRDAMSNQYSGVEDNPFCQNGMTAAWDERHNRVLLGKIVRSEGLLSDTSSFTLSFSFDKGEVVSYHSYLPSLLYYNRSGLFSLDNAGSGNLGRLYKHNFAGTRCRFYDTTVYPFYIDVALVYDDSKKQWHCVEWVSYSKSTGGLVNYQEAPSHIMVYNDHQCSDLVPLIPSVGLPVQSKNTRHNLEVWSFNELRDVVINPNSAILTTIGDPNSSNLNINKPWHKKGRFLGRTLVVRLYHNNSNQKHIHIIRVDGQYTPAVR